MSAPHGYSLFFGLLFIGSCYIGSLYAGVVGLTKLDDGIRWGWVWLVLSAALVLIGAFSNAAGPPWVWVWR